MASNFDGSFETLRWHLHDKSEMPVSLAAVLVLDVGVFFDVFLAVLAWVVFFFCCCFC